MSNLKFSQGRDTYDNKPVQRTAADFEDFVAQISQTGSTRKGEVFVCAPLTQGAHNDPARYPGIAHWRIHQLAQPREFLALDGDYFANAAVFTDFQQQVAQWSCVVYTTASHIPTAPRARAIIELDRAVHRAEGIALGEAVERLLISVLGAGSIKLDPSVYRAEQPIYTPLIGSQIHRHYGQPLNVDAVLSAYPVVWL